MKSAGFGTNPMTTHDNAGIAAWRFNLKAEIHSYADAAAFLKGHGAARDLGPNMRVRIHPHGGNEHFGDGYIAVVLYETEIVRHYPDETFSVDNGGFSTPTTMYRVNAVIPEGWSANHHRRKLALRYRVGPWLQYWPCTHDMRLPAVPEEWLVLPDGQMFHGKLQRDDDGRPVIEEATCGACGFTWNDALITHMTPTPAGRCPNEYGHEDDDDE